MDSITQAALGAVVGEVILGRKLGWRAAAWGAFLGTFPDLDIIAGLWLDSADYLNTHRGISHSLLLIFLAPLILGGPLAKLHQERGLRFRGAAQMIFWVYLTHVLIDCFTTYGTQVFEPFNNYRLAFNNLSIIDLLFTLPLLLALGSVFFFKPKSSQRKWIGVLALGLSTAYACLSFGMKTWAYRAIETARAEALPDTKWVSTAPTLGNTILWRGLLESEDAFWVTYWSPFDKEPPSFDYFPKNHHLLEGYGHQKERNAVIHFSGGNYVVQKNSAGNPIVIDMRYSAMRDPKNVTLQPLFQWEFFKPEGRTEAFESRRPKRENIGQGFRLIWERLTGKREKWESVNPPFLVD